MNLKPRVSSNAYIYNPLKFWTSQCIYFLNLQGIQPAKVGNVILDISKEKIDSHRFFQPCSDLFSLI